MGLETYDLTLLYTIDQEFAVLAGGYMYSEKKQEYNYLDGMSRLELRKLMIQCLKRIKDVDKK